MNLDNRYIRVTHSGKVDDRFLTVQVAQADTTQKQNYGALYFVIEILSRWYTAAHIGQAIVNTLRREYFKSESTSDLENFELAVKKVNDNLAAQIRTGDGDWIGKINAALMLVNGADCHLAVVGEAYTYLARDGDLMPIVKPKSLDSQTAPDKIFATITSGTLASGDRLFVATSRLFETLTVEEVKTSSTASDLREAALGIVRQLKRLKETKVGLLALQIDQNPEHSQAAPAVIYLDQAITSPLAEIVKTLAKAAKFFGRHSARGVQQAGKHSVNFVKTRLAPATRLAGKKLAGALAKTKSAITPARQQEAQTSSLIGKTIFNIHNYSQPKSKRRWAMPKFKLDWWQRRNRPILYFFGVVALIFTLVVSISIQKKNEGKTQQKSQSKIALGTAKQRLEEGKTALIFNNKQEAQKAFAEAIKMAKSGLTDQALSSEAKNIINETETQLDKLVGSNRLKNLRPAITFERADAIVERDGKIVAIDREKNALLVGWLIDGKIQTAASGVSGKLTALTATVDKTYVATSEDIYEFDSDKKSFDPIKRSDDVAIKKAAAITQFIGNLYALSPTDNQVWKYQLKDGVFQKETGFLRVKSNLSNARAIAIDGTVYVLDGSGKILKLSGGAVQTFNVSGLPKGLEKIEKPIALFTSEDTGSIFVADAGGLPRLLEFDKQGKFIQQFLFESDLEDFKDIWFSPGGRKAWALFGKSVYEINL